MAEPVETTEYLIVILAFKMIKIDPENIELTTLLKFTGSLSGKRVLEVGCGDGRLTWQYASLAREVVGIDPDQEQIAAANQNRPSHVHFLAADIIDFHDPLPFDVAILSWSL